MNLATIMNIVMLIRQCGTSESGLFLLEILALLCLLLVVQSPPALHTPLPTIPAPAFLVEVVEDSPAAGAVVEAVVAGKLYLYPKVQNKIYKYGKILIC